MELKIDRLCRFYGSNRALEDFSYTLTPGVYGLLGPNGAGKSTLINVITDNLKPTSGILLFNGTPITELKEEYRREIGFVPQQQQMFPGFTLRRFLYYMAGLKGIKKAEADGQIEDILKKVNLVDVPDRKMSALSGGMKQRALLAQALLGNPGIIILDEPTAGLDPKERVRFRNLVAKVAFNRIVIIATHVVSDIQYIANRVLVMNRGHLLAEGTPWKLCEGMKGKVYEVFTDEEHVPEMEKRFRVADMVKEREMVRIRVLNDGTPDDCISLEAVPNLEDVYLYLV